MREHLLMSAAFAALILSGGPAPAGNLAAVGLDDPEVAAPASHEAAGQPPANQRRIAMFAKKPTCPSDDPHFAEYINHTVELLTMAEDLVPLDKIVQRALDMRYVGVIPRVVYTPEAAENMLPRRYEDNRKHTRPSIEGMRFMMENGLFGQSDSALSITTEGVIINGNGRTTVLAECSPDVEIEIDVKFGMSLDDYRNMDQGLVRKVKDLVSNNKDLASAARICIIHTDGIQHPAKRYIIESMEDPKSAALLADAEVIYRKAKTVDNRPPRATPTRRAS